MTSFCDQKSFSRSGADVKLEYNSKHNSPEQSMHLSKWHLSLQLSKEMFSKVLWISLKWQEINFVNEYEHNKAQVINHK